MTPKTLQEKKLKAELESLYKLKPHARLTKWRHHSTHHVIAKLWPNTVGSMDRQTFLELLHDILYVDRLQRRMTQGEEEELKEQLSQEKQIELGYEVGYTSGINKLNKI